MPKIKIQTHRIQRSKGRVVHWGTLKLIKVHRDAINQIGKDGSLRGNDISIEEYFDQHLSTPKSSYKVETIWEDIPNKKDLLLIIEVTI